MRAMILAAGRGDRMRPLTDRCPKPLLEAGGRSLIAWHLEHLAQAGFRDVVINHAWLGEMLEHALGDGSAFGVRIHWSPERSALETAGGVAQALPMLGADPFLVVNGDVYTDWPFARARTIAEQMLAGELHAWLVLADNPPHHAAGDFGLATGRLTDEGERLTFSGLAVYRPEFFEKVPRGAAAPLAPLLYDAARARRAGAERLLGAWLDVGTPQRLAELDARLRARAHPAR